MFAHSKQGMFAFANTIFYFVLFNFVHHHVFKVVLLHLFTNILVLGGREGGWSIARDMMFGVRLYIYQLVKGAFIQKS